MTEEINTQSDGTDEAAFLAAVGVQEPTSPVVPTDEAPAPEDPAQDALEPEEPKQPSAPRRKRGELGDLVAEICSKYVTGELGDREQLALTPARISRFINDVLGVPKIPSVGAITNVLTDWEKVGFAVVAPKPLRFVDFTEVAHVHGLAILKEQYRAANKQPRKSKSQASGENATPETAPTPPAAASDVSGAADPVQEMSTPATPINETESPEFMWDDPPIEQEVSEPAESTPW